jgi:hypothetical protein
MVLADNCSAYIEEKYLPDVILREPSKLVQKEASAILNHWYQRSSQKKVAFRFKAINTVDGPFACQYGKEKGKSKRKPTPFPNHDDKEAEEEQERQEQEKDEQDEQDEQDEPDDEPEGQQKADRPKKFSGTSPGPPKKQTLKGKGSEQDARQTGSLSRDVHSFGDEPKIKSRGKRKAPGPESDIDGPRIHRAEMSKSKDKRRSLEQSEGADIPITRIGPPRKVLKVTKPIHKIDEESWSRPQSPEEPDIYRDSDTSGMDFQSDNEVQEDEEDFSMFGGPAGDDWVAEPRVIVPRAVGNLGPPSSAESRYDYLAGLTSEPRITQLADALRKCKVFKIKSLSLFNLLRMNN